MTEESQVPGGDAERPAAAPEQPITGDLEQALAEERQKADRLLANWQRAEADLINYRRRVEQEKTELVKHANAALIRKLLPVLDDLDRAMSNAPAGVAQTPWFEGLRLAQRKFLGAIESEGVTPIDNVGQPFDPRSEEAVLHEPGPEGTVTAVLQKGYRYDDRVLRPALVKVGSGQPAPNGPAADDEHRQA
ncbi:MAG: nucleotide exchange factor GrpE [Chloroflexi bacterium]|nr:nucleotide exchange factor GrpE [Chloroflexota bacterium]